MTYFVGIDIAKFKHDCFIVNENGEVIKNKTVILEMHEKDN